MTVMTVLTVMTVVKVVTGDNGGDGAHLGVREWLLWRLYVGHVLLLHGLHGHLGLPLLPHHRILHPSLLQVTLKQYIEEMLLQLVYVTTCLSSKIHLLKEKTGR